ncbi:MAG: hypothetical protein K9W46_08300 [Candidatus Heimdallarchaeum endolithica]|uniref:Uncharacterized protein n=1 Tax=Candidatus Heimdallarchaeum endolithica TaxID=2876572 RepID=A0A9Y1FM79_9ARCH|nr:MAG: hypothetical protein K9W46_08300 [Candidatus Heimdallarchaeum endolithica]
MKGIEDAVEEIKQMFWGVLKGSYNPEEEEDVKVRLITALSSLTAFAKSFLPEEQQQEYEEQFSQARSILQRFDSAGPWFRELPEMIDAVYNILTYANVLQIEVQRYKDLNNDALQYYNIKLEKMEMKLNSLENELRKIKTYIKEKSTKEELKESETTEEEKEEKLLQTQDTSEKEIIIQAEEEVKEESKLLQTEEAIRIEEPETTKEISISELEEVPTEKISTTPSNISEEDINLIEGIELASKLEEDHIPIKESLETESESLQKLANLLQALDPGDDLVLSPLTQKLLKLSVDEEKTEIIEEKRHELQIDTQEQVGTELETVSETTDVSVPSSVDRLSDILASPDKVQDAATFISAIRDTIEQVAKQTDDDSTSTPLTRIIEAETGQTDETPLSITDIENIISHLENKRENAIERVKKLEKIIATEKMDEAEWQDLMINAQQHLLRIEDTLDGYKRVLNKLRMQLEK